MKNFPFFSHRECEAFPCHNAVAPEDFNCLFCFCPLYLLGKKCGGNFSLLPGGIKDCSNCSFPHERKNYGRILALLTKLTAISAEQSNPSNTQ